MSCTLAVNTEPLSSTGKHVGDELELCDADDVEGQPAPREPVPAPRAPVDISSSSSVSSTSIS